MAIIKEDEEPFEAGTTISSRVRLTDEDGDITGADIENGEVQATLEVQHSNSGETVKQESTMEEILDDDGKEYYLGSWSSSEDAELGQYLFIHRATVNGDPYRMTELAEVVEVKDDC